MPTVEKRIDDLYKKVDKISSRESRGDIGDAYGSFMFLRNLRGFWPMSSVNESGNPIDISGQGRTLTNNNAAVTTELEIPYFSFNGTSQYLSRADEAGFDLTAHTTFGGWFNSNNLTNNSALICKDNFGANQRSYLLSLQTTGAVVCDVFPLGTSASAVVVTSSNVVTASSWFFAVGRYTPSTELAIFLNGVKTINTTTIPAANFSGTAAFTIAALADPTSYFPGKATMCFLCASALSDTTIAKLFNSTRMYFDI